MAKSLSRHPGNLQMAKVSCGHETCSANSTVTTPRQIIPGRYWMITRRCTQRQFLLRPCTTTIAYFEYCLGLAAERSGVQVVAFLAMSNHYHAVVFDPLGRLPVLLECFNKLLARALNAHWGRWENFWSSEAACATHLATPEDVLEKVFYVLANPVADHLVDRVVDWPGANSLTAMLSGNPIRVQRPRGFFRENGPTPGEISLHLVRPPGFERHSNEAWSDFVRDQLASIEAQNRRARVAKGVKLFGKKAVLRDSIFDSPSTSEPRRNLRPALACKNSQARILAIRSLRAFRLAYLCARQQLAKGMAGVVFPLGTYRMRLLGMT